MGMELWAQQERLQTPNEVCTGRIGMLKTLKNTLAMQEKNYVKYTRSNY